MPSEQWSAFVSASPQGQLLKRLRDNFWLQITPDVEESLLRAAREDHTESDFQDVNVRDIPVLALHLLILTEEILLTTPRPPSRGAGEVPNLAKLILSIEDEKVKHLLSLYLVTRFPDINEWISNGVFLTLESVESDQFQDRACRMANAVWVLVCSLLVNSYGVDARMLLSDTPGFIEGFCLMAFNPVLRSHLQGTRPGIWAFARVVDAFPTSPAWNLLMNSANMQIKVFRSLTTLCDFVGKRSKKADWRLTDAISILRMVILLSMNSEMLATKFFASSLFSSQLLDLLLDILEAPCEEFAALNLAWLCKNHTYLRQDKGLFTEGGSDLYLNDCVIVSGCCLTVIYLIGRTTLGAELLYTVAPRLLVGLRRVVDLHGEEILKKLHLWSTLIDLIPVCITGKVSSSAEKNPLLSLKRLKHNNLLLPCTSCSRLALGSRQLKICGECHLVRYCGRECQQRDWHANHMLLCMPHSRRRPGGFPPSFPLVSPGQN